MTNADKIRQMTDEELANYIFLISQQRCTYNWKCKTCPLRTVDCTKLKGLIDFMREEVQNNDKH